MMDPEHSLVEFSVRHMMIASVKGRFGKIEGTVRFDPADPASAGVAVSIAAESIDTGIAARDAHLRSSDFFDVEAHPVLTYAGRAVDGFTGRPGEEFRLRGDLTIRGTTLPVTLDVVYQGRALDADGGERLGFSAAARIDRRAFGLTWNQALETGGLLVGNDVRIGLEVELHRAPEPEAP